MTGAQQQAKPGGQWRTLFDEQGATLTVVAEMLLRDRVPPGQILDQARAALEGSSFRDPFAQVAAIRAVAQAAIAYNRSTANSAIETEILDPWKQRFPLIPNAGMLPWPERAVYFLRGVLRYSCQDTALLLGMSDANIDQLHKFAQKRIRYSNNASVSPLPDVSELPREVRSDRSMAIRF